MATKEKVKRSAVIKAAKELNTLLFEEGDEQMMNVKANEKDLLGQLKEASSIIDEGDEISDETRDTLIELGFLEGEAEEEEEEESEEDLLGLIKRSPKLQQLKDLVKSHDELKSLRKKLDKYSGLQGTKKLREDMLSAVDELPLTKKKKGMSTKRKETAKKAPAKKESTKTTTKKKVTGELSNKAIVYNAWKKTPKITVGELYSLVNKAVKENTIKGWLSQWKRGTNFPAIAKR